MADSGRAPKRKDYERIALQAAQASIATQTTAHVAVLEAADRVADTDTALTTAQAQRDAAALDHARTASAFAGLVGHSEAAARLGLSTTALRTLIKTATRANTPTSISTRGSTGTTADPADA